MLLVISGFYRGEVTNYIEDNIIPVAATVSPKLKNENIPCCPALQKDSGTLSERGKNVTVLSIVSCQMILSII